MIQKTDELHSRAALLVSTELGNYGKLTGRHCAIASAPRQSPPPETLDILIF